MRNVLGLTHAQDTSADMVWAHLERMSVPRVRFNTEEFPSQVGISVSMDSKGKISGRYQFPETELAFEEVGVVWNRRVKDPIPLYHWDNPSINEWALEESRHALFNSFTLIDAPVVNPWEQNEHIKFNKLLQMRRAAEMGFEVPVTIMTSEEQSVGAFLSATAGDVVVKKIRRGLFLLEDGKRLLFHTTRLSPSSLTSQDVKRLCVAPTLMQDHIVKRYDIRSVVVRDQVFSVAIHSQQSDRGKTDFRTALLLGERVKHEAVDLGPDVNSRLVAYTKSFGLTFGAIDLVLSDDDILFFLEDNPNGQWGWLEQETALPISLAIAECLRDLASG